nr:MAG TPA: hypothetical protein [Caudoviricetes sp.]
MLLICVMMNMRTGNRALSRFPVCALRSSYSLSFFSGARHTSAAPTCQRFAA